MGNGQSVGEINGRISKTLPHHTFELAEADRYQELTSHPVATFAGHKDRSQFIDAVRILLSSNGTLNLGDKHFRLIFTRAQDESESVSYNTDGTVKDEDRIFASIVASTHNGPVVAKIAAMSSGTDRIEAFKMLIKTVQILMHSLLADIPSPQIYPSSSEPASSRQRVFTPTRNHSQTTLASTILPDEPPTYQEANNQ